MSGRNTRMAQWLDYRVRVTISDARMLVGTFMAFDKYMNVVLADCEELSEHAHHISLTLRAHPHGSGPLTTPWFVEENGPPRSSKGPSSTSRGMLQGV